MQRSPRPPKFPTAVIESSGPPQLCANLPGTPFLTEGPRRQKRARLAAAPKVSTTLPVASDDKTDTEPCVAFEGEEGLDVSFPLKAVERSFRCSLCNGYFRDAVTIKECLHTFCRWCLYSYVEGGETEEVCCPFCERNMQLSAPHRDGESKRWSSASDWSPILMGSFPWPYGPLCPFPSALTALLWFVPFCMAVYNMALCCVYSVRCGQGLPALHAPRISCLCCCR